MLLIDIAENHTPQKKIAHPLKKRRSENPEELNQPLDTRLLSPLQA
jgi:hypothetical protein